MTTGQPFQLRIQLLGGFSIQLGDRTLQADQFRLRKSRNLVKLLALAPHHRLHRDQLVEQLWPDLDPEAAVNNLHQALYAARKLLASALNAAEALQFKDEILYLCLNMRLYIDAEAFDELASQARRDQDPAAFQAALDLYTGELLPDDLYEDWAANRRELLHQAHLRLLLEQAALYETQQDLHAAIAAFQHALSGDPGCEEAHAGLMRLYARSGQRSAALSQYETCRLALQNELGVEPSPQTVDLYERIRSGQMAGQVLDIPPQEIPVLQRLPELPTFLIPFVGRRALLGQIHAHLADATCRLLTLAGPGGSGKTRLAVESAAAQLAAFTDGVVFIPLAGLQSAEWIVPAIAQALNFAFHTQGDPRRQLLDYLREKQLLLVMDNFEHLLSGAGLISEMLVFAAHLKILVTSRVGLNVQGETLLSISGMNVPELHQVNPQDLLESSAVKLFLEGARRVAPAFKPGPSDLEHILHISRQVQGMPLAILLAAAWMRLLTPAEIEAEIAANSLDFLDAEWQDVPERQRSLRAVFDHSWRLLSERERRIFAGLSVFRGGFTLAAAQPATGVTLRELMKLVNHSFLERASTSQQPGAAGRYELHELLRQYGEEKLNELPDHGQAARDRHAAWYSAALQRWAIDLKSARQMDTLAEMDLEIDNIRAAWKWAIESRQIERLAEGWEGLVIYYFWRSHLSEGGLPFQQAADLLEREDLFLQPTWFGLRAVLLSLQCLFTRPVDQNIRKERLSHSLELAEIAAKSGQDVRRFKAYILWIFGRLAGTGNLYDEDIKERKVIISASKALFQEIGDRWGEAQAWVGLGNIAQLMGDYSEAVNCFQNSLAIRQELGVQVETMDTRLDLAFSMSALGRIVEAEQLLIECVLFFRRVEDQTGLAKGVYFLLTNLLISGKYRDAAEMIEESITVNEKVGDHLELARTLRRQAQLKIGLGEYDQAQVALNKGYSLFQETGTTWGLGAVKFHLGELALVAGRWVEAKKLLQESIGLMGKIGARGMIGQPLAVLGIAELKLNDISQARQRLAEVLVNVSETHEQVTALYVLGCAILFFIEEGNPERAVELHAQASLYPFFINSTYFHVQISAPFAESSLRLPSEVVVSAQQRGRARDLWATIDELLADPLFSA